MTRGKAKQLRAAIEAASASLDDQTASTVPELYPEWDPSKLYTAGDRVQYGGVLYKCLQAHTAQEAWSPTASPSLWAQVLGETLSEWVQPDSTNPYMKGDKVIFNGQIYASVIDNNVWSPSAHPAGWEAVPC